MEPRRLPWDVHGAQRVPKGVRIGPKGALALSNGVQSYPIGDDCGGNGDDCGNGEGHGSRVDDCGNGDGHHGHHDKRGSATATMGLGAPLAAAGSYSKSNLVLLGRHWELWKPSRVQYTPFPLGTSPISKAVLVPK